MNKTLLFFILLFFYSLSYSQEMALSISYLDGEKSKDSHATIETFTLGDSTLRYMLNYTGHRTEEQVDKKKTCKISKEDSKILLDFILTNNLNKNDSLFQELSKTKNFEIYTNIVIAVVIDNKLSRILINGDIEEFKDKDLYIKAIQLIVNVRTLAENCINIK
ncbi:MAG: hypothetical protein EHM58_15090 [Ignavibacteriae bacterium]|nr:MAG: hypothetical protein EHM58_15090 [Ignavibacteriota bacterium]